MQYHAEFNHHREPSGDRTPWNIAEQNDDDRVVPVFRKFAKLRERLVPYLSEQARVTVDTGAPFMRPLFFDFPEDDDVWSHPQQWLLGNDVLVSPVTKAGAQSWDTYLPKGEWVDAWTGQSFMGERVVSRTVPIDEIPVYVRASSWEHLGRVFTP
jgi:alpha-glucosidase (family GH31 glycosyl hydrolase)